MSGTTKSPTLGRFPLSQETMKEGDTEPLKNPPIAETELIAQAKRGNNNAFMEIAGRHMDKLFDLAFSLTGNSNDAEDILQETLLGAFEGISGFEGRASIKTWLTRILMNQVARHRRFREVRSIVQIGAKSEEVLRGVASPETPGDLEIRMDVMNVLQTLPLEYRTVIIMRELQGLAYAEIAEILGLPVGTVESRLFRARQQLQEKLQDYFPKVGR